ncbi:MAG: hypothetical protein H6Q52_1946 [Deltaproteobacteria bacterium]|nr:hypothetical protein [Deltaproteobacteria bacterium]
MGLGNFIENTEQQFFEKMKSKYGLEIAEPVKSIVEWARNKELFVEFSGEQDMSCSPLVHHKGQKIKLIVIWTSGTIYLPFTFGKKGPFHGDEDKRTELIDRFRRIPVGFDSAKTTSKVKTNPKIHLGSLKRDNVPGKFIDVLEWELQEIMKS